VGGFDFAVFCLYGAEVAKMNRLQVNSQACLTHLVDCVCTIFGERGHPPAADAGHRSGRAPPRSGNRRSMVGVVAANVPHGGEPQQHQFGSPPGEDGPVDR
jgi:hypothetical protein